MKKITLHTIFLLSIILNFSAFANDATLRILVVYTQKAATQTGGADLINTKINNAIRNINDAFQNSGIDHEIVLAGIRAVDPSYTEVPSFHTILQQLTATGDGVLDEVHAMRTQYRADVVALIVDEDTRCGLADNTPGAHKAFMVVDHKCLGENYSLARQLGYLYQAGNHESQEEAENAFFGNYPNGYAYGHQDENKPDKNFKTIMGYTDEGRASEDDDFKMIPYFSTPDVTYRRQAVGDDTHKNAYVMRTTIHSLACYKVNRKQETLPAQTLAAQTLAAYEYVSAVALESLLLEGVVVDAHAGFIAESGKSVRMLPGTHLKPGAAAKIKITPDLSSFLLPPPPVNERRNAVHEKAFVETQEKTSIQDEESPGDQIVVYPNPFTEEFHVKYQPGGADRITLLLYNFYGQQVEQLSIEIAPHATQGTISYSAGHLSPGVYFYQLSIGDSLKTGTLLKQ